MHVRLLAGYAADAVIRAAMIAEIALKIITGKPPEAKATLGELIDERRRSGKTELLADASWLNQRGISAKHLAGQVREELDDAAGAPARSQLDSPSRLGSSPRPS